jgi:hypothetical protein
MTDARLRRFWHRAGPLTALGAMAFAAVAATQGCGGNNPATTTSSSTGSPDSSSSSGAGGNTSSSSSGVGGGGLTIQQAAAAPIPLDATPDPAGVNIYFTAIGANGAGVFQTLVDGSQPAAKEVQVGDPFVSPFGIMIGTDGKQLYVADPGADVPEPGIPEGSDKGAIFSLPIGGGTPNILLGSEGTVPRGIDIVQENGKDVLYFTGTDKTTGQPGVFKLAAGGGGATMVVEGAPFLDPSGIAVAKNGDIFVADTVSAASHTANIIKISGGAATTLVSDMRVGYPAGLALTMDEKTLYVSAIDAVTLTDAIAIVDVGAGSGQTPAMFSTGISTYTESAGLHRSKNSELFAWADSSAGPTGGKVFAVK